MPSPYDLFEATREAVDALMAEDEMKLRSKADVLSLLGEPDLIVPRGFGIKGRAWLCSTCRKLHTFPEPVGIPAPCECGGIAFEKRSADQPTGDE